MTNFNPKKAIGFSTVVLALGIIEVGSTFLAPVQAQDSRSGEGLPSVYWEAIEDARIPEPNEVFRNLTAITPHNRALNWDDRDRVLVTTWTTWNGYTQNVGNQLILTRDLWVTVVPDLQNFCKRYTATAAVSLPARINQLLGLPPEAPDRAATRQIVEIWVDPQFIFRPSADPEITDHEAELSFRPPSEFVAVSLSYQHWFYAQYDQRYQSNGVPIVRDRTDAAVIPYPWTQLGYTYDWGNPMDWRAIDPTRPAEVGLSEFVVRQWSPIAVHAAYSVDEYCDSRS